MRSAVEHFVEDFDSKSDDPPNDAVAELKQRLSNVNAKVRTQRGWRLSAQQPQAIVASCDSTPHLMESKSHGCRSGSCSSGLTSCTVTPSATSHLSCLAAAMMVATQTSRNLTA